MAVERAPYINYSEVVSYQDWDTLSNGAEIPLFVVKTNNVVNASDIKPSNVKRFISYTKFKNAFSIPTDEAEYNALDSSLKDLDTILKDYFTENSMYSMESTYGLNVPYVYVIDVGDAPTIAHYEQALSVSEAKRNSSVAVFPNTEDINFMKAVDAKLKTETGDGVLRISYFRISGQGNASKLRKGIVIRPTFNHHGYANLVKGYKLTHEVNESTEEVFCKTSTYAENDVIAKDASLIYQDLTDDKYYKITNDAFVETTLEALDGYSEVIEVYKHTDNKFYNESTHLTEVTPVETALYLNDDNKTYTYTGTAFVEVKSIVGEHEEILYDGDADFKLFKPTEMVELGGATETFEEYCERLEFISREVNSSRVCIVDKPQFGKTIARICSTPYYLEPGYLPYMTVSSGVFEERSKDDRDSLFATGLIFNEDDTTLPRITPRICLATSTAWGIEDHDMRPADALLHARRNVDYHVRNMLRIIAPQLKRNETSVTLRHVQNQLDIYLNNELENGTIIEYSFELKESSYNPYTLLLVGNIMPVNSTLAINFENTIRSPYAIASDYV